MPPTGSDTTLISGVETTFGIREVDLINHGDQTLDFLL